MCSLAKGGKSFGEEREELREIVLLNQTSVPPCPLSAAEV